MSIEEHPESFDIALLKQEEKQKITQQDNDNLDEFVGQLQDAFSFANKTELNEQLIFIAIEKTFKEYFDCVDMKIETNYKSMFQKMKLGA